MDGGEWDVADEDGIEGVGGRRVGFGSYLVVDCRALRSLSDLGLVGWMYVHISTA